MKNGEQEVFRATVALDPKECLELPVAHFPSKAEVTVCAGGVVLAAYAEKEHDAFSMPEPISDMPLAANMTDPQELYLAGVHVGQYRDPAVEPDSYFKEALKRNPKHIPSLIAMARYEYNRYAFESAKKYAQRAIENLCLYNERPESGEAYYVYAQILEAVGDYERAYTYYYKSAWSADCAAGCQK